MSLAFDNSNKKGLSQGQLKTIDEMKANIPRIEASLGKIGKIIENGFSTMWYTGFGWCVKMNKGNVYLRVEYSDSRFEIHAVKLKKDETFKERLFWEANTIDRRYEICKFTDWITLDRLENKLISFSQIL